MWSEIVKIINLLKKQNFCDFFFYYSKFDTTCKFAWQLNSKEFETHKEKKKKKNLLAVWADKKNSKAKDTNSRLEVI